MLSLMNVMCATLLLQMTQSDGVNMAMQVEHAISDGYDVRSFLYWTLVDNFEVLCLPAPAAGISLTVLWIYGTCTTRDSRGFMYAPLRSAMHRAASTYGCRCRCLGCYSRWNWISKTRTTVPI